MNGIMVSIIITYYNQKKYIASSLMSVLSQITDFKFEILCGDDGSNDGTYEELLEWQKKYFKIIKVERMPREKIKYEPIKRVSKNRKTMLSKARGKYVAFLDGDDCYLNNNKLQKQFNMLENNKQCIACGHPIKVFYEDGRKDEYDIGRVSQNKLIINNRIYWSYLWLHADTFLYRNIFLNDPDRMHIINDDFFDDNTITCHFLKYGDLIYLPESMVGYRQIGDSSWNSRDKVQKAYINFCVYNEVKRVIPEWSVSNFIRNYPFMHTYYENRNNNILEQIGNNFNVNSSFFNSVLKYYHSSFKSKIKFEMRYFGIMHCGLIFTSIGKICAKMYKKID